VARRAAVGASAAARTGTTVAHRPATNGASVSETSTYKIVELTGTSPDGVTEAMQSGISRASKTLRNLDWVEVVNVRGHVEDGTIAHYQVTMKVGFRLEE
jgi:flavin-binding protein dodecin